MAHHIKNIFSSVLPEYESWKIRLIKNWNTAVGDLHEHLVLINIQNKTLILGVYDAVWLQELYMLSSVLIKTVNDYLENEYIVALRFKNIGHKKNKNIEYTKVKQLKKVLYTDLSNQEKNILKNIKDHELRLSLEQYLIRCKERE